MICRAIPYNGKDPYIFVSYCREDRTAIYPMLEQLAKDCYRIWFDDGSYPGSNLIDSIENHLEDCKVVVAFISENFSMSHICKSEIVYAIKCKRKVIPVLIDSANLPKGLRMQLNHLHFLQNSQFSSNGALLNKIYEAEECKECKAPTGSIILKDDDSNEPKVSDDLAKKSGILSGLKTIYPPFKKKVEDIINHDIPAAEKTTDIAPDSNDDSETVISEKLNEIDDDNTVYGTSVDDTIRDSIGLDNDITVRASSRSIALLLHPAEQRAYTIKKPQTKIGRSPIKCDVVIEGNDSISKLHAEILQYNHKFFLIDSNSANGTFINGDPLESGKQAQLKNPSIFKLNDETLILIYGTQARKFINTGNVSLLINESNTAVKFMDADTLPLNRSNKWPDGTLSDPKIHRARDGHGHAMLSQQDDGVYLVDDSPNGGNGTHLNGRRLKHHESRLLTNGDRIRLGDTTLEYVSITI